MAEHTSPTIMNKHLIPSTLLLFYIALLIKVMVFKDVPAIKLGQMILNFGGTQSGRPANFIPFATILPYLMGDKGLLIAGINLIGNIVLLVPLGFLFPFAYPLHTRMKSFVLAVTSGMVIEVLQVLLHVGIFDIDDVILNALGVMIGYGIYVLFFGWYSEQRYLRIALTMIVAIIAGLFVVFAAYPHEKEVNPTRVTQSADNADTGGITSEVDDPCGGTGGIGEIIAIGQQTFTITRKDGKNLTVTTSDSLKVFMSTGSGTFANLQISDKVTLVGGPTSEKSFAADAVYVCNTPNN